MPKNKEIGKGFSIIATIAPDRPGRIREQQKKLEIKRNFV
jgi:hypothetical protein